MWELEAVISFPTWPSSEVVPVRAGDGDKLSEIVPVVAIVVHGTSFFSLCNMRMVMWA